MLDSPFDFFPRIASLHSFCAQAFNQTAALRARLV